MTGSVARLPVEIGAVLNGKYVVEDVLGEGGMGVVVRAHHVSLDQKVAIKFLLAEARAQSGVTDRFANEAKASARLKSDHVVRILDVDAMPDGTPYMVMEYLEGRDLAGLLAERGRISVREACGYVLQACEALAEAHAKGIIHRDLKPGNLFIARGPDGEEIVKLLDFGISKIVAPEGSSFSLTKTSAVLGSPLYMPPEQMSSARTVDARADLWSLGVVLYEAVTGTPPFDGMTLTTLVANIIQEAPKPMVGSGAVLEAGFEDLVLRCLEKNPANRIATVSELAQGLARFVPGTSRESLERIERFAALRPSVLPQPPVPAITAVDAQSAAAPTRLVRVVAVPPVTVATAPRLELAAVTNAAQTLDTSRKQQRLQEMIDGPVPAWRRSPSLAVGGVALVLVVAAAGTLLTHTVGGGRSAPDTHAAGPPEPRTPIAAADAASGDPSPDPNARTPAPPPTFASEPSASSPPASSAPHPPRAAIGKSLSPTYTSPAPPGNSSASPGPANPPPPPNAHAAHLQPPSPPSSGIDMEPK